MYPDIPRTQVIVGSMNMGYISDTARDRTHDLFRPKREPIPLGHSDGRQVLIDLGLVSPIDWSKIMDRSKIRRECSKTRENLQQNDDQFDHTGIQGVFFDGRKDQTLTQVSWHWHHYHRNTTTEEHKYHRRARASFYALLSLYYIL